MLTDQLGYWACYAATPFQHTVICQWRPLTDGKLADIQTPAATLTLQ